MLLQILDTWTWHSLYLSNRLISVNLIHYTPEARRLAPVGSRSQANLRSWANVQVLRIYSLILTKSTMYSIMLIKLDNIFIFAMYFAKIMSLMGKII